MERKSTEKCNTTTAAEGTCRYKGTEEKPGSCWEKETRIGKVTGGTEEKWLQQEKITVARDVKGETEISNYQDE